MQQKITHEQLREELYEQEEDHNEPRCIGCGVDSPLTNTMIYSWICDDCLSEYERIDGFID